MTPLTWLTIYYQAACRQYHAHSSDNHAEDSASPAGSCLRRQDGENVDELENVPQSSADGGSASVEERPVRCGCSDCFLHVPQYSKRAYLQIVRVSFQLFGYLKTMLTHQ